MTIHLIKSAELSAEVFTEVYDLLTAVDGTIQFRCDPESIIDFEEDELYKRHFLNQEAFSKMKAPPEYDLVQSRSYMVFPSEVTTASWSTLFKKCEQYRKQRSIPHADMVLLLTDIGNK